MLLDEIRNIKSSRKELRNFGLTFGIVFVLVGSIMLWRGNGLYPYAFGIAMLFALLAFTWSFPLKPLQKVWMALATVLGFIISRIILVLLFYLILTPVSLAARLFGKRFLELKPDKHLTSYWNLRVKDPSAEADYTKQY